jgi:hypothetical protein
LFYHQAALDQKGKVVRPDLQQKAIDTYTYILQKLSPSSSEIRKSLEDWRNSQ